MSGVQSKARVHWRSYTRDPSVPSFRYRCLIPALALQDAGLTVNRFSQSKQDACLEEGGDVLVLVKTISAGDLELARAAKAFGQKVVLDLCDNAFFWLDYYDTQLPSPDQLVHYRNLVALLTAIGREVDAIVVPTESLKRRMRDAFPGARIEVIPDVLETASMRERVRGLKLPLTLQSYFGSPYRALKSGWYEGTYFLLDSFVRRFVYLMGSKIIPAVLRRLQPLRVPYKRFLIERWPGIDKEGTRRADGIEPYRPPRKTKVDGIANRRRLIWFGNSGISGVFGVSELKQIEPGLVALNQIHPIVLTVVSESDELLSQRFPTSEFPIEFVRWSLESCPKEIRKSEVVLLPNSDNDFAKHKSANRAVLAFSLGKPVVASRLESLQPFRDCILFDDFKAGVAAYLESPDLAAEHVRKAQRIAEVEFSERAIANRWAKLLNELAPISETARVGAFPAAALAQPVEPS